MADSLLLHLEDNLPSGAVFQFVQTSDGAFHCAHISAGIFPVTGVSAADVRENATLLWDRVHPEDRLSIAQAIRSSAQGMHDVDIEVRVTGPMGELRWVEVRGRPRRVEDGIAWDGFLSDVTDRKRGEQILAAENQLSTLLAGRPAVAEIWQPLLEAVGGALGWEAGECWQLDPTVPTLRRTHAWTRGSPELDRFVSESRIWEFPAGDGLPGLAWQSGEPVWMPDLAQEPFFRRRQLACEAGLGCGVGVPVRQRGTCVGVIALFSRPPGQDYPAMRSFMRGIGFTVSRYLEYHRAESELREAKDAAERANRAKDLLLANVSHELRTPLTGILGMTELTLNAVESIEHREWLVAVRESATGLIRLVNDLLDVARVESGKLDLRTMRYDLPGLLRTAVAPLAVIGRQKGLVVDVRLDPALPTTVTGDPDRLRQVLTNLVGNAVQFTDAGTVTVTAVAQGQELVLLTVDDTGIGIPEEKLAEVFEPFTQIDPSDARRYGGLGLGLAICRRIVTAMGGRISGSSLLGQGSRFEVLLRLPAAEAEPKHPETTDGIPAEALTVVVADDQAVIRRVVVGILTSAGHKVFEAADAGGALAAVREHRPDVVLLDLQMPGGGVVEAVAAIRAMSPESPGVIAFTARALGDQWDFRNLGFDGLLTKPFSREELLSSLMSVRHLQESILDPRIDIARRIGGDPELLSEIVLAATTDAARLAENLQSALASEDWNTVAETAHAAVGAVGIVSRAVVDLGIETETLARGSSPAEAAGPACRLVEFLHILVRDAWTLVSNPSPPSEPVGDRGA